jgi:signal transduction histidine kinase
MAKLMTFLDEGDFLFDGSESIDITLSRQFFVLNKLSVQLSTVTDIDTLYKSIVEFAHHQLNIDHLRIILIDKAQNVIQGTWGTDTNGEICSEHSSQTIINHHLLGTINALSSKDKVCIWEEHKRDEFSESTAHIEETGTEWHAAIGLWQDDRLLGWISCDNLLNQQRILPYQGHVFHSLGLIVNAQINHCISQSALKKSNSNLQKQLQRQTHALQLANQHTATAKQMKSQLMQNLSHELRTPLNSVIGRLHLIDQHSLDTQNALHIDKIKQSAQLLKQVVSNVIQQSELEQNLGKVLSERISIDHICETVLEKQRKNANDKNISLFCEINNNVPYYLYNDAEKIQNIINSIIDNAVKFTSVGSVLLKVEWLTDQSQLSIHVIDSGKGIPSDQTTEIFSNYLQLDAQASRQFSGLGLGLAITKSLVDLLSGRITCESTLDSGSQFTILIPCEVSEHKPDNAQLNALYKYILVEPEKWLSSLFERAQITFSTTTLEELIGNDLAHSQDTKPIYLIASTQKKYISSKATLRVILFDNEASSSRTENGLLPSFTYPKLLQFLSQYQIIDNDNKSIHNNDLSKVELRKSLLELLSLVENYDFNASNKLSTIIEQCQSQELTQTRQWLMELKPQFEHYDYDNVKIDLLEFIKSL